MEDRLRKIEREIGEIQSRNARVEADKAWETSKTRIVSLAVLTYIVAVLALYVIGATSVFFNALIPTIGFLLSVQTLPIIKKRWVHLYHRNRPL